MSAFRLRYACKCLNDVLFLNNICYININTHFLYWDPSANKEAHFFKRPLSLRPFPYAPSLITKKEVQADVGKCKPIFSITPEASPWAYFAFAVFSIDKKKINET